MSIDVSKRGSPTPFQDTLGRAVYEQAATGAYVPAWSTLSQARRWRWIWAGEAAVAIGRASAVRPSVIATLPPVVHRSDGTNPLQMNDHWGDEIRRRRKETVTS